MITMQITSKLDLKFSIFKLASSTIINHKIPKDDVRLPTLDRKRLL